MVSLGWSLLLAAATAEAGVADEPRLPALALVGAEVSTLHRIARPAGASAGAARWLAPSVRLLDLDLTDVEFLVVGSRVARTRFEVFRTQKRRVLDLLEPCGPGTDEGWRTTWREGGYAIRLRGSTDVASPRPLELTLELPVLLEAAPPTGSGAAPAAPADDSGGPAGEAARRAAPPAAAPRLSELGCGTAAAGALVLAAAGGLLWLGNVQHAGAYLASFAVLYVGAPLVVIGTGMLVAGLAAERRAARDAAPAAVPARERRGALQLGFSW